MGYGRTSLSIFHYDMLSVANESNVNASGLCCRRTLLTCAGMQNTFSVDVAS
jgi:hypothetical protein